MNMDATFCFRARPPLLHQVLFESLRIVNAFGFAHILPRYCLDSFVGDCFVRKVWSKIDRNKYRIRNPIDSNTKSTKLSCALGSKECIFRGITCKPPLKNCIEFMVSTIGFLIVLPLKIFWDESLISHPHKY